MHGVVDPNAVKELTLSLPRSRKWSAMRCAPRSSPG